MVDGNRRYPVDEGFLHHSVGSEFINSSDLEVQDWFDAVGKARGYQNGALRSYHQHPQRPKETYAMAQLALRKYTADGNKYGWRLTLLMQDPWSNVAWHCGSWPHNQRSIGIEVCGNYLNVLLDDKALMLVADYFRGQDRALNGAFTIWAHKYVFSTACPGQIETQIGKLVDMLNNKAKWDAALWPAPLPPPPPPPPVQPEWVRNAENIVKQRMYALTGAQLVNITTGTAINTYPAGTPFDVTRKTTAGGQKYYITEYSAGKNIWNGLKDQFLTLESSKPPAPPPPPPPAPTPPAPTPPSPTPTDPRVKKMIDGIQAAIKEYEGGA